MTNAETRKLEIVEFKGNIDLSETGPESLLETEEGLELITLQNGLLMRTLSRAGENQVVYYEYNPVGNDLGIFNSQGKRTYAGPFWKGSADQFERELYELIDRKLTEVRI